MKEFCKNGHPFDDANTYVRPDGKRQCRACKRAWDSRYQQTFHRREWCRRQALRDRRLLKLEALNAYGGPVCIECGETDVTRLTLDHINNDGGEHRLQLMGSVSVAGTSFYRKLRQQGWPTDPPLQVLCMICNHRRQVRF